MFDNYHRARNLETKVYCKYCKKDITSINRQKVFYTSPFNFILEIVYDDEDAFNLKIDEKIDISNYVERRDVSRVKYTLVGAIFIETDDNDNNKFVSISKLPSGQWIYFNGNSIKNCSFGDLQKKKHLQMLFYSSN